MMMMTTTVPTLDPSFRMTTTVIDDDDNNNPVLYNKQQYYALVVTSMMTGTLSVLGSLSIIISSYRKCSFSIHHKLLFMISIWDGISSLSIIFHQIAMPRYIRSYGSYLAFGNMTTCSMFGFMTYLGPLMVSFYSCYLSCYFYAKVRYNILDRTIQTYYQTPANIVAWMTSFSIPIIGLLLHGYKPRPFLNICQLGTCQIGVPGSCTTTLHTMSPSYTLLIIVTIIQIIVSSISVLSSIALFMTVRHNLLANTKYHFHSNNSELYSHRNSSTIMKNHKEHSHHDASSIILSNQVTTILSTNQEDKSQQEKRRQQNELDVTTAVMKEDIDKHHGNNTNGNNDNQEGIRDENNVETITPPLDDMNRNSSSTYLHRPRDRTLYQQQRKEQHNHLNRSLMIQVRDQALMYSFAYFNSSFWYIFVAAVGNRATTRNEDGGGIATGYMILSILIYLFCPMQGFVNCLVYTRPRYVEYRKLYPNETRWKIFLLSLTLESTNSNDHGRRRYHPHRNQEKRQSNNHQHHDKNAKPHSGDHHSLYHYTTSSASAQFSETMPPPPPSGLIVATKDENINFPLNANDDDFVTNTGKQSIASTDNVRNDNNGHMPVEEDDNNRQERKNDDDVNHNNGKVRHRENNNIKKIRHSDVVDVLHRYSGRIDHVMEEDLWFITDQDDEDEEDDDDGNH